MWGRVGGVTIEGGVVGGPMRGKEDEDRTDTVGKRLGIGWTVAYYAILVSGAVTWWKALWILTASDEALVEIDGG